MENDFFLFAKFVVLLHYVVAAGQGYIVNMKFADVSENVFARVTHLTHMI